MKIGLVSFDPIWLQPLDNLRRSLKILNSEFLSSCDMVVFPEMTFTGFSPQHGCLEVSFIDQCLSLFGEIALQKNIFVVFGALSCLNETSSPTRLPTNNAFVIAPSGELLGTYSKIHLFSMGDEELFVRSGDQLSIFSCGDINFSLSICYDLRFPEIYSSLADKVHLFINIASWPSQRTDHWCSLLKARAIENQAYVVGVNRTGKDGNNLSYDLSTVVYDPLGQFLPLVVSKESERVSCVDIDILAVGNTRSSFGVLNDKRPSLYQSLFSEL